MQMDDLQKWYREGLDSRIEALVAAKKGLATGDQEVQESLRRIAHALRGSGATYGFPQITEAGAELEDAPDDQLAEKTENLIEILRSVTSGSNKKPVTILIVEDEVDILEVLKTALGGPNRSVCVARNLEQARSQLAAEEVSLVILDLVFPHGDGRTLLMEVRQDPRTATVPVIVLSGRTAAHTKIECFALGADDYFEKPFNPDTLALSVTAKLQRWGEISLESLRDTLTGLPNRAAFQDSYNLLGPLSVRQQQPLCLSMLDLDHFKNVNDSYGHVVGDEVLQRLADVLTSSLRKSDIVARWGGEEFVVLFPNTGLSGAKNALQKALDNLRQQEFRTKDGRTFRVTFTGGVTQVENNVPLRTAIELADTLMYKAKEEGRNRVIAGETA